MELKGRVEFWAGQEVAIPCEIQPGGIGDELLVNIETGKGVISGFIKEVFVEREYTGSPRGKVRGVIMSVGASEITVKLPGSFFTTAAGMAFMPFAWATNNIKALHAA